MFRFPSVICTRCTGFFCLAIIKGPPNDIYCIIEEPYKHYFTEKVSYSLKSRFRKSILFCCIKNSFNSASPCFLLQISKTTAYNHYYTDYQIDKPPFFHLLAPLYPCIIIQVYDSTAYFSIQEKHQKNNRKINGFQLCIIFGEIFTKKFF